MDCLRPGCAGVALWAAASWRNDVAIVKAHLAAGTNDEVDDWTGKTPLHYAAEYGNL